MESGSLVSLGWFLLLAIASACSSVVASGDATVMSDSSALRVSVHTLVQPPVRGTMSAELTVTAARTGDAVDGLVVSVEPWMPSMNHGSSVVPAVTPEGGGKYRIDNLVLFMPGLWELRVSFSGATPDHAEPEFEVP